MAEEDLSPGLAETVRALAGEHGPCPPADALVAYDELGPAARGSHPIDGHVQTCSRCQLTLLHLHDEPVGPSVEALPTAGASRWRWTWGALAVAAAALLVLSLPVLMRPRQRTRVDGSRRRDVASSA